MQCFTCLYQPVSSKYRECNEKSCSINSWFPNTSYGTLNGYVGSVSTEPETGGKQNYI